MTSSRRCPLCNSPLRPESAEGPCPRCRAREQKDQEAEEEQVRPGADDAERQPIGEHPEVKESSRAGRYEREAPTKSDERALRYTRKRIHSNGGLGLVWLAWDTSLGRDVALKQLKPNQATRPEARSRFVREARVTGQLEHPNIVPVYEFDRKPADTLPYYTMRFLRGRTLGKAIEEYTKQRRTFRCQIEVL